MDDVQNALNNSFEFWTNELAKYTMAQLCMKPSPTAWSMEQLYRHLIESTSFYVQQARTCASNDDNEFESTSSNARVIFQNNSFPDIIISGPSSNDSIGQSRSKTQLLNELMKLRDEVNKAVLVISESSNRGKTKHPRLHYFDAAQWMRFAEMHLRHHLKQKKGIDEFIKTNSVKTIL